MSSESRPDPRVAGPWDVTEVDGVDTRMDFGSLWIRGVDGLQVQAQMDDATKVVGLITLTLGSGAVQLQVFAAPRTAGLWDDVRSQLASSVTSQGGVIEEGEGEFGIELRGRVPGQGGLQPVRFVGVDGPGGSCVGSSSVMRRPWVAPPNSRGSSVTLSLTEGSRPWHRVRL